ncbi:MAG: hypothetical protein KDA75_15445, partial [Planctomycetaceae bacterium]|nr:hypothetical protein [Planctomycetaceae bacterium]
STRVYAESLLMLCSLGAWISAGRLLDVERPASHASESHRSGVALASITGGLLALAWLAKGTGLLLLAGTLAAVLVAAVRSSPTAGWRRGLVRCVLILTAFVAVGSPLLIRNLRRFGSPFYNVNSQLLFVDEYADPAALAAEQTTSEAARGYWATHTVGQMLWREAHGCVWETYILLRSLGPAPLDDGRILFGFPIGLLALLGLLTSPRFPGKLTGVWTLLLWLMFAWYVPIAAGERFLIPLLIPLLLAAAVGMARLLMLVFPEGVPSPETGD